MSEPGRSCPLRYRYAAAALAGAPEETADTLYVVGGLYGNLAALEALDALIASERRPVTVCFNGDFNWFNVDDTSFAAINRRVLEDHAIQGNVEAELNPDGSDAGCGCAYPPQVDDATVARSNRIHARLRETAARQPALRRQLAALPMYRRYRIADLSVAVVHGDADSLAGWRFDVAALDDPAQSPWRERAFADARVNLFASSHTCLPALRSFQFGGDRVAVINNGSAGMANFRASQHGVISRISAKPPPIEPLYGTELGKVRVDALPLHFDNARWRRQFLACWPAGSDAHTSYFERILHGPDFDVRRAGAPDE